jgi:hypothetical protein
MTYTDWLIIVLGIAFALSIYIAVYLDFKAHYRLIAKLRDKDACLSKTSELE